MIDDFVDDELYEFDANGEENQRLFRKGFLQDFEEPFETAGKRFWGWSCGPEIPTPGGGCVRTCTYRVFWQPVRLSNGEFSDQFSCDNLPGNNPRLD